MISTCPVCRNENDGTLTSIENESLNSNNSVNWTQDNDSLTCAICLDEINSNESSMLRCGHKYHTTCITTWFEHSQHGEEYTDIIDIISNQIDQVFLPLLMHQINNSQQSNQNIYIYNIMYNDFEYIRNN